MTMPFTLIKGTFHLVGQQNGQPNGFQPDGDSIQFKPANLSLLNRLNQIKRPYHLSSIGSTQLRFEGLDALELHFAGAARHQPRPLADVARDFLTGALGLNPVPYDPPDNITVDPPVPHDAAPGYILSRSLEVNGRPVAFAFAGDAPEDDGDDVFLDANRLRNSLNFALVASGNAYPLFYDTLFVSLRTVLATAATQARTAGSGLWPHDLTSAGLNVQNASDLEQNGVIFPKLFRRLSEFLSQGLGGLDDFLSWLEATIEQVLDLTTTNITHFDDLVTVAANTVSLTLPPEQLVFISAK
jgi:endonuclease YncB( thermonuclease family)